MAGHGAIIGLGGTLADHDLGGDELLASPAGACLGDTERPSGAQARDELTFEGAPPLNVKGLVDRLMGDPHRLIFGEVDPEPVRDLLRTPRSRPTPVPTAAVATVGPLRIGARHQLTVRPHDHAGGPVLHIPTQRLARSELAHLRPAGAPLRVPLRGRRPILQAIRASGRVAAQLSRDRRGRATHPASDLTHPLLLSTKDRDLLPLSKRQIAPRPWSQRDWRHPTSLPKPPRPNSLRDPSLERGILTRRPTRNRLPEPDPVVTPRSRRAPRRPHLTTHRTNRLLTLPNTHRHPPPSRGVARQ